MLRLRHGHHEQAVAIDRLDPRRIDGRAKAQRATEFRRTELLPDRLRTLRHAELHLTLNDERVVMDGHVDALLVKAWRQQRGLVAVRSLPDVDRQRLVAGRTIRSIPIAL